VLAGGKTPDFEESRGAGREKSGVEEPAARSSTSGVFPSTPDVPSRVDEERAPIVAAQPCPLLVPLVEEGWLDQLETEQIVRRYLEPLRTANIDTLILGCTHYPLLEPLIARVMGEGVKIVNPARAVAATVRGLLQRYPSLANACRGTRRTFHFTDTTPHTERIASEWLGMAVEIEAVELPNTWYDREALEIEAMRRAGPRSGGSGRRISSDRAPQGSPSP
jgi:hypothetical protein